VSVEEGRGAPRETAVAAALGLGLLTLYWLGRSHSYGPGDSPQHVMCGLLWGVPHPPGYPLQTALAWGWSHLGWAEPAAAINGLSGLLHAAAASVFFLLLRRAGCRSSAALAGAALMALSPLFWFYSLVAEVRALNDLLALLSALFALDWARRGREKSLHAFALCFGLGLSHHPTFVLLAPAYAVWILGRRPSAREAALCAGLAATGLAVPYVLLGLRLTHSTPSYDLFEVRGWKDLPSLFLRSGLGGPLRMVAGNAGGPAAGSAGQQLGWLLDSIWTHAGPGAIALGAGGALSLWRRGRRELLGWTLWGVVSAGAVMAFAAGQMPVYDEFYVRAVLARFHLLPMIALFVLAGHGAEALARSVRPIFPIVLAVCLFVFPVALRPLSLAHENPLLDYVRSWLRDSSPGDIIVLGSDDTIFAAWELELVRKESGGRVFLIPTMFAFPPYLRSLKSRYPALVLPPLGAQGLPTDWAVWEKLNTGRAVLLEPSLLDAVRSDFPRCQPQGGLVRVETARVKSDAGAQARRFLQAPETTQVTRWSVRPWTQEVYVLRSRRRMAEWLLSRLDASKNSSETRHLRALLRDLELR